MNIASRAHNSPRFGNQKCSVEWNFGTKSEVTSRIRQCSTNSDFGMSKTVLDVEGVRGKKGVGPVRWMSPESIR